MKFIIFSFILFFSCTVFCQSYDPISGRKNFKDSIKTRYKNNAALDSVLTTDTSGRIFLKKVIGSQNLQQVTNIDSSTTHKITASTYRATSITTFANNAAAVTAGLQNGDFYYLPYNNGSYLLAIVVGAILSNALLASNGTPILTENNSPILTY